MHLSVTRDLL
ncbi:uncharacterized protein FFE2_16047 [Fusarium fujikuroi]|nr:uncharacterized protein FFE2_16047 [Fusarium fujikuroi]